MIRQPKRGSRNVNEEFYKYEAENIDKFNEIFGDISLSKNEEAVLVWLCGWDDYTVHYVLSAIRKAISANDDWQGQSLLPE